MPLEPMKLTPERSTITVRWLPGAGVGEHGTQLAGFDQVDLAPHEHGDDVIGQGDDLDREQEVAGASSGSHGPHALARYPDQPRRLSPAPARRSPRGGTAARSRASW